MLKLKEIQEKIDIHEEKSSKSDSMRKYDTMFSSIMDRLQVIKDAMKRHKKKASADPKNWGYAGDLGKIDKELKQIIGAL